MNIKIFLEHIFAQKKRKSGDKYTSHPYAVKKLLQNSGITDEYILNAALLHDVLEDSHINKNYLELHFGNKVATIVDILSKKKVWKTDYCKMKSNLDQIQDSWTNYPETIVIKLADRLHNLETIHAFNIEKQKEYLNETKSYLIPLFENIIKTKHLGKFKKSINGLFKKLLNEIQSIENARIFLKNNHADKH